MVNWSIAMVKETIKDFIYFKDCDLLQHMFYVTYLANAV